MIASNHPWLRWREQQHLLCSDFAMRCRERTWTILSQNRLEHRAHSDQITVSELPNPWDHRRRIHHRRALETQINRFANMDNPQFSPLVHLRRIDDKPSSRDRNSLRSNIGSSIHVSPRPWSVVQRQADPCFDAKQHRARHGIGGRFYYQTSLWLLPKGCHTCYGDHSGGGRSDFPHT